MEEGGFVEVQVEFGAIEVTRYNNDIQGREITWRLPPRDNVRGRTVLVADVVTRLDAIARMDRAHRCDALAAYREELVR